MVRQIKRAALLLALPLGLMATACGDSGNDRAALEEDELSRDLDLALQSDTAVTSLQDTAVEAERPGTMQPAPRPRPRPRTTTPPPPPVTRPDPVRPDPTPDPPAPRRVTSTVGIGETMALTLDQDLSTRTNQVGDGFTATLAQPVLNENGQTIIPAGAKVRGRVTQVQKSGRVGETAVLSLAFETVSFGGNSYPLDASVVQANPERVGRSSTGEQVGKVAAGAAAGAVLGKILGGKTRDAVKGAVIGAAAGTAIAMGTADVDAVLRTGSSLIIRVDRPITITRTVS
jgi:hypothetical protein